MKGVLTVSTLHVVYRCSMDPAGWHGYVPGHDVHAEADSLAVARREIERCLFDRLTSWPEHGISEHLEYALGEGLWMREALDDRVAMRGHTSRVVLEALADHRLHRQWSALPDTTAGGVIVLATLGGDTFDWVRDQHDGLGALVIATALANHRLWWNTLTPAVSEHATDLPDGGSLTDLELATTEPSIEATIDTWLAAVPCGRNITADTVA